MKNFKLIAASFVFLFLSATASAQTKTEKIKVAGECGMCKKKIEKAAKEAGATSADWNTESKILTVKYNSNTSNTAKIEKAVATVGYDTPSVKATDEAYEALHFCCKYERATASSSEVAHKCCDDKKCEHASCMKDGKCAKDMSCCKDSGCEKKDCCKKA